MRIKWLGCACFEMDFGGVTVVNDPWITENQKTELTWETVEKCDYITLTHGHHDHIMDIPALMERFNCYLMCGECTAMPLMKWADVNPMRLYPMTPNLELDLDGVKIKALYGRHVPLAGTASEREKLRKNNPISGQDPLLGELSAWGDLEYRNFLYTAPDGTKVLIWGNKLAYPEQRSILRETKADIAVLQMTGANRAEDLVQICKEMDCKVVIPHHFDYPGDYMKHVKALEEALAKDAPHIRFIVPNYGEWIEI